MMPESNSFFTTTSFLSLSSVTPSKEYTPDNVTQILKTEKPHNVLIYEITCTELMVLCYCGGVGTYQPPFINYLFGQLVW